MAVEVLRKELAQELEKLTEDRLREVMDFVGYLLEKERRQAASKPPEELDPARDPLLRLIGTAEAEPFSQQIDEDLYGS